LKDGVVHDRFYLRFTNGKSLYRRIHKPIRCYNRYTQNAIIVNNPTEDEITEIVLYNILGQTIFKHSNQRSAEILIPIKGSIRVYITKVKQLRLWVKNNNITNLSRLISQ
jgi:hypothetical protein